MWAVTAAAVALVAGAVELVTARKRPPPLRALHWAALRVGLDALAGALSYPIASAAAGGADGLLVAVTAGVAGPSALRAAVFVERPDGKSAAIGLERRYRWLMKAVNGRITQLGAASESAWVNDVVLPKLGAATPDDLFRRTETYFFTPEPTPIRAQRALEPVRAIFDAHSISDDEKRRRLVSHLLASGHRAFVQSLLKVAPQVAFDTGRKAG